jgi:chromosome segregation ATPase
VKKFYEKTIENYVSQAQKDALAKAKAEQDLKAALEKSSNLEHEYQTTRKQLQKQMEMLREAEEDAASLRIQVKRLREDLIQEEEKTKKVIEEYGNIEELKANYEERIEELEESLKRVNDQVLHDQSREQRLSEQVDRLQRELALVEKTKRDMEEGFRRRLNETLAERMQDLCRSSEEEAQRMKEELKDLYNEKLIQISRQREEDLESKAKLEADNVSLTQKVEELEDEVLQSLEKTRDLEQSLHNLQKHYSQKYESIEKDLNKRESILKSKEAHLQSQEKHYEEVLEHNLALQAEIRAYHKLLKAEEDRSTLHSPSMSSRKRTRTADSLPLSDLTPSKENNIPSISENLSQEKYGTCTIM